MLGVEEGKGKFAKFDGSLKGLDKKVTQNLKQIGAILVFGTTPDEQVSLENACYIINNTQEPKKIWIFEGVGHDYAGAEKEAVKLTIDWFKQWLR